MSIVGLACTATSPRCGFLWSASTFTQQQPSVLDFQQRLVPRTASQVSVRHVKEGDKRCTLTLPLCAELYGWRGAKP